MKSLIIFFSFFFLNINFGFGQSKYLGMSKNKIIKILLTEKIDIVESTSDMIHSVDDKTLCNLIFYFDDNDNCYHLKTTFQEETGFFKLINYYQVRFKTDTGMEWAIPFKNGVDSLKASRQNGFDLIEETFHQ